MSIDIVPGGLAEKLVCLVPDILQVIVDTGPPLPHLLSSGLSSSSELDHLDLPLKPDCPICLSPPTASRMTRCGHIFCHPCILHYLELSEEGKGQGRKCPVCWELVLKKDLKQVKWHEPDTTNSQCGLTGDNSIRFRLVERPNFTTLALPRSSTWLSSAVQTQNSPWHFTPDALSFAKFMMATPEYMIIELQQDLRALKQELEVLSKWSPNRDVSDDLGVVFVRAAEAKVRDQIQKAGLLKTQFVMTARKSALKAIAVTAQSSRSASTSQLEAEYLAQTGEFTSTDEDSTLDSSCTPLVSHLPSAHTASIPQHTRAPTSSPARIPLEPRIQSNKQNVSWPVSAKPRKNLNPPEPSTTTYRYYQIASGQHVYLSPLDIRILLAKFGSYDNFPESINLRVEAFSEGRMTDELRRRCKYLSHLPTGCEVSMAEVDLDKYLENDSTLASAVKQRRAKRKEKNRKEDKAKAKSELLAQNSWNPHFRDPERRSLDSASWSNYQSRDGLEALLNGDSLERESSTTEDTGVSQQVKPSVARSGAKTVWGTTVPQVRPDNSQYPVTSERDAWASFGNTKGAKNNRINKTELVFDDDDVDGTAVNTGGKSKSKRKNKITINLAGGSGGRGF